MLVTAVYTHTLLPQVWLEAVVWARLDGDADALRSRRWVGWRVGWVVG
jgi:hypothetical protein